MYPAAAKSLQSCPTLCDPINGSPPGSPVPGILQARTLEWVAISFSCMTKKSESEVTESCLTLSDPMDCSLPGSSVHGIFQARVLEWVAITFSKIYPSFCEFSVLKLLSIGKNTKVWNLSSKWYLPNSPSYARGKQYSKKKSWIKDHSDPKISEVQ